MIKDIADALERILFFLKTFDSAWKSGEIKECFPPGAKDKIEEIECRVHSLPKHEEITKAFADWRTIGVWNASDVVTFMLTSRLTIYLADALEENDSQGVKDATKYLLNFINYLLLSNIHGPSKNHGDYEPYNPSSPDVPETYEQAQQRMRECLSHHFTQAAAPIKVETGWFGNRRKRRYRLSSKYWLH